MFNIFTNPSQALKDEKYQMVSLKIIDNLFEKEIPEIIEFFVFNSLEKVL